MNIVVSGDLDKVFLTSGFLPPFAEGDLLSQVDVACHFQAYATGGSVLHLFIGEELSVDQKESLIKSLVFNFPIQYFTITPLLTVCNTCSAKKVGKHRKCGNCHSDDVTIWCRPVGYFRPVLRGRISKDFRHAQEEFWIQERIVDFSQRKVWNMDDIQEIINEIVDSG